MVEDMLPVDQWPVLDTSGIENAAQTKVERRQRALRLYFSKLDYSLADIVEDTKVDWHDEKLSWQAKRALSLDRFGNCYHPR